MTTTAIDNKTKVPIGWIFAVAIVFISTIGVFAGGILYVSDLKSDVKINKVKIVNVEEEQKSLKKDIKEALKEIKTDIKTLMGKPTHRR